MEASPAHRSGSTLDRPGPSRSAAAGVLCSLLVGLLERRGDLEPDATTATPLDVIFGRFELLSELGRGAAGVVYRGRDRATGEEVAVKQVEALTTELTLRVHREILALRALPVPGVVRLVDEGPKGAEYFIVMELVEGEPFPGRRGPLPWDEARPLFVAFLETLARVHALCVVHRDLKPSNVLVTAAGRPVFLDFGLARGRAVGDTITRTGDRLGTPRYWSPEQLRGRPVDARADIYAAGVMFLEALAGPTASTYHYDDWLGGALGGPVNLSDALPHVPASVVRTLGRMLSPDPERRTRSAAEALATLLGESAGDVRDRLPRLGGEELVAAAARAIARRRPVVIHGPPGSGRTRCAEEAISAAAVTEVLRTRPAEEPFASVAHLAGDADIRAVNSRSEAEGLVVSCVGKRLT